MARDALKTGYVVSADDVEARPEEGDTVSVQVTIDTSKGCDRLTQRILRFARGRSRPRAPAEGMQEILSGAPGHRIVASAIEARGRVPDVTQEGFAELAEKADAGCPFSYLIRASADVTVTATLES